MFCGAFTKILTEEYFQQNINDTMQVGKKLLDYLLFKVAYIDNKDKELYDINSKNILQTIIGHVGISDIEHLAMCFGNIAINQEYQVLNKFQKQISVILKSKQKQLSQHSQYFPSYQSLNKTYDNSHKSSFNGIQVESIRNKSINYGYGNTINSRIRKVQDNNQQDDLLIQLGQQFKKLQPMKHNNLNDLSISSSKSAFSKQKSCFQQQQQQQQANIDVQQYLQKVNKNTELNYVVQMMKLELKPWQQKKQGSQFVFSSSITVPSIITHRQPEIINGQGQASNKKDAKSNAGLEILRKLFTKYPKVYRQFLIIKKRKAL